MRRTPAQHPPPPCHAFQRCRCFARCQYPYVNAFPGPRSIVLLDNASIHHSRAFVRRVNRLGGMVIFLPPYCFTTSPLDNGAYGLVVRWLQRNAGRVRAVGLQQGMDEALSSLSASDARYCFQNCGYVVR